MVERSYLSAQSLIVEEQVDFSLAALCQASGASVAQVHSLVGEGVLLPAGLLPAAWLFRGDALARTRRALRLARDFELELPAVALVLELLREIESLRAAFRRT